MQIERIHMDSFMGKKDFTLEFSPGVNVIEGNNESGKSTIAEFIKFMLYGALSKGGALSERQRFLGFSEPSFGGWLELSAAGGRYRIDRTVSAVSSGFRESVSVSDLARRTSVFKGENPGEALLSVPENVFVKTAYISQAGDAYTGGDDLSCAIENLLFSADETVSTEKALKKLEKLRILLLYKNGKGGLIYDEEAERAALAARLERALSDNSEIIAKEGSLGETLRRIEENKTDYARAKKLCDLYDNYVAYTRFRALDETDAEAEKLKDLLDKQLARFDGFVPDGEYLGRLRQMADSLGKQKIRVAQAQTKLDDAVSVCAAAEAEAADSVVSEELRVAASGAIRHAGRAGALRVIGAVLIAVGALLGVVGYLMRMGVALYVGAAAGFSLGLLCLIFGMLAGRRLKTVLRSFGVPDAYALAEKLREDEEAAKHAGGELARAREQETAASALLENEKRLFAEKQELLDAEVKRLCGEEQDDGAFFALVEAYITETDALRRRQIGCAERRERLLAETRAYDRAAVEEKLSAVGDLGVFEKLDIAEYSRRRDFSENAIAALEMKKSELERSLAALRATVENPALLRATLEGLDKKLAEAKKRYAAISLAIASIERASEGLRMRVSPQLAKYAGEMLSVMTDGRYTELGVDGALTLTYMAEGGAHSAEYLSKGTREAAYFALRLALFDLLYRKEKAPLLLDEALAHTDDARTVRIFRILLALAKEGQQSLVFTCHGREGEIAESLGVPGRIRIS